MHGGVWQAGNGSSIASTEPVWHKLTLLIKPSHDLNSLHYIVGNANMEFCIAGMSHKLDINKFCRSYTRHQRFTAVLTCCAQNNTNNCFLCVLLYKE